MCTHIKDEPNTNSHKNQDILFNFFNFMFVFTVSANLA